MLSTDDPKELWRSIGELSGWRLLTYNGFVEAVFTTAEGHTATIDYPTAHLLDTLVCAIGDITDDVFDLLELCEFAVDRHRATRVDARKALLKNTNRIYVHMKALREDLPQFFAHSDKNDEIREIAGTA